MRALILMLLLVPNGWAIGPSRIGILVGADQDESRVEAARITAR